MIGQVRAIGELDRIIHEPGRLMIVALLSGVERADFLFLLNQTGMNKGTLSSHLSRLEEAGYVEVMKTYRGKVPQRFLLRRKTLQYQSYRFAEILLFLPSRTAGIDSVGDTPRPHTPVERHVTKIDSERP